MGWLLDGLWESIKQGLIEAIMARFAGIYDTINAEVGSIAANVGQTPGDWNPGVFAMIRTISETAVLPIAGMILTFVLCYELIQVLIEKNNMHEFDTFNLYKWIFKTFCAVWILTHTFDIVMGVFELAQNVINTGAGVITDSIDLNSDAALANLEAMLQTLGVFELMGLWLETFLINICLTILTICIFIIIFGRMIEIYLTVSVAPIPLATMVNREWGQMGNNYLKGLFALGFQGFLILICVAVYAALVQNIPMAASVHGAIWGTVGYTVLLCFALFKTGSLSRSLFSAH
jgi:uncharacterized membrane protein YqaE (UPF0057 family)